MSKKKKMRMVTAAPATSHWRPHRCSEKHAMESFQLGEATFWCPSIDCSHWLSNKWVCTRNGRTKAKAFTSRMG